MRDRRFGALTQISGINQLAPRYNPYWVYTDYVGITAANSNTASTDITRMTQQLWVCMTFLVVGVVWDIRTDSTYTLRLVTSLTGTTVLRNITVGRVTTAADNIVFYPDAGPFVLPPNIYYFQMVSDSGGVGWKRPGVPTAEYWPLYYADMAYDADASTQTAPVGLQGYYLTAPLT